MQNPLHPTPFNRVFAASGTGWAEVLADNVRRALPPDSGLRMNGIGNFGLPEPMPGLRVAVSNAEKPVRWPGTGGDNLHVHAVVAVDRQWHRSLNTGEVIGPPVKQIAVAGVGDVVLPRAASRLRIVLGADKEAKAPKYTDWMD